MSDGFIGFKALGWGAGALLAVADLAASASSQRNPLRIAQEKSFSQKSTGERQPPSLLKKASYNTGGSTTTAGTSASTTTIACYPELSSIRSNSDPFSEMNTIAQSPSARGDDVGAFRFNCQPGQIRADDPLV